MILYYSKSKRIGDYLLLILSNFNRYFGYSYYHYGISDLWFNIKNKRKASFRIKFNEPTKNKPNEFTICYQCKMLNLEQFTLKLSSKRMNNELFSLLVQLFMLNTLTKKVNRNTFYITESSVISNKPLIDLKTVMNKLGTNYIFE